MPQASSRVPLTALYGVFFWIGLFSFGGGLSAWMHREIVISRRWLTDQEFVSGYALGQILPGVNSANIAIYIGQHLRGAIGATVALVGMLSGPFVVVIAVGMAYHRLVGIPGFPAAMAGIAAVAVGMLLRMGVNFAGRVRRRVVPLAILLATFLSVGVLKWPLVPVVLVLAPLSIAAAWPRKSADA